MLTLPNVIYKTSTNVAVCFLFHHFLQCCCHSKKLANFVTYNFYYLILSKINSAIILRRTISLFQQCITMYYLYCYQCVGRPAALDCGHPERERRKSPSVIRGLDSPHLHTTEQHTSLTFTQQTSTLIPHIHKRTHTHTMVTSFALRKDEYTLVLYVVLLYDVTQLRR